METIKQNKWKRSVAKKRSRKLWRGVHIRQRTAADSCRSRYWSVVYKNYVGKGFIGRYLNKKRGELWKQKWYCLVCVFQGEPKFHLCQGGYMQYNCRSKGLLITWQDTRRSQKCSKGYIFAPKCRQKWLNDFNKNYSFEVITSHLY